VLHHQHGNDGNADDADADVHVVENDFGGGTTYTIDSYRS
jgi:hypothetical protein